MVRGGQLRFEDASAIVAATHELKSPLVLIRQLAFAAADEQCSPDERNQLLNQLSLVADRGLKLTTDLTKTVRLEDSLFELEPVNALQLCEAVVKQIAPLYEQYGRKIQLTIHRSRPPVLAHRELLESVVYHFADNALHYGDHGSVRVTLSMRTAEKKLRIGVRDEGPAMSLREWRSARTRLGSKLATRPQASGLGLYITEQFSRAMNGETGLIRHRDGATFYIDLPISEQLSLL